MSLKTIPKITDKQMSENGVRALADRPNLTGQYGVGGLSATQLKVWFDKLALLLAERVNEITKVMSSDEAADYIRICLDEYGIDSLGGLVLSFANGSFAEQVLKVYPNVVAEERKAIQEVIYDIAREIAEVKESGSGNGIGGGNSINVDLTEYLKIKNFSEKLINALTVEQLLLTEYEKDIVCERIGALRIGDEPGNVGGEIIPITIEYTGQDSNGGNRYKITFSDGSTGEFVAPKGSSGEKGVSIESIDTVNYTFIGNNTVITIRITYDNGDTADLSLVIPKGEKGDDGKDGVGIESIARYGIETGTGNLIYKITLTNGKYYTITVPKGDKGEKGDDGDKGEQGEKGDDGKDGRGILSIYDNENGGFVINYTDGTSETIPIRTSRPTTAQSNSLFVIYEDSSEDNLFEQHASAGVDEFGNAVFTWDSLAVKIKTKDLIDINSFSNGELNLKQGESFTIYPFFEESSNAEIMNTWTYSFNIENLTTSITVSYNGTNEANTPSGAWRYCPYTITLKKELANNGNYISKIIITDGEDESAITQGVDFSKGVTIKVN